MLPATPYLRVRVLLDENLPLEFAAEIPGHEVTTVRANGWAGLKNGALMQRAATMCDLFVTMDKNIQYQQHIAALPFGVILLSAPSNRLEHLRPLVPKLLVGIAETRRGELLRIGG
jgi:hypothetical protein